MRESKIGIGAGVRVASWLNGAQTVLPFPIPITRNAKKRILDLLDSAKRTRDSSEAARRKSIQPLSEDKLNRFADDLNEELEKYKTAPFMRIDSTGKWGVSRTTLRTGPRSMMESVIAHDVAYLFEWGLLDRIRLCICEMYFFATRDSQTSCSPKCRHKRYEQDQAYKAKRKIYNREVYLLKKNGKVK